MNFIWFKFQGVTLLPNGTTATATAGAQPLASEATRRGPFPDLIIFLISFTVEAVWGTRVLDFI